jgi:hypothetical protein
VVEQPINIVSWGWRRGAGQQSARGWGLGDQIRCVLYMILLYECSAGSWDPSRRERGAIVVWVGVIFCRRSCLTLSTRGSSDWCKGVVGSLHWGCQRASIWLNWYSSARQRWRNAPVYVSGGLTLVCLRKRRKQGCLG